MRSIVLTIFALAATLATGCGSGEPSLVPVVGTVSQNGKPLDGASVEFIPSDASQPQTPGGDVTDGVGKYTAKYRGNTGLSPGKYKVTVRKASAAGDSKIPGEMAKDPFMGRLGAGAGKSETKNETRADFDREVPAAGGTLDLEIKGSGSKK
jgi:hypothetical protein